MVVQCLIYFIYLFYQDRNKGIDTVNFNNNIGMTLSEYYIDRNVSIIRRVLELRKSTTDNMPIVLKVVAKEFGISPYTVRMVFYDKNYAYASEAWAIVNKDKAGNNE